MTKVTFMSINSLADDLLKYAVIVSRHQEKWIYCKHKQRDTWEIPGGRREFGEPIFDTAKRELFEETGALAYTLMPVCAYCVIKETKSYGLLCFADVESLGPLPVSEIKSIHLFEDEPQMLTYPQIQPLLLDKVKGWLWAR